MTVPLGEATERLASVDDMASLREAQFTEAAMAVARQPVLASRRGVCLNCGERCLPAALYCDPDCQGDHEHRQRLQRLAGRLGR